MESKNEINMRLLLCLALIANGIASAETPASALWTELKVKREKLTSFHQEFDVTRTYKTTTNTQASKWQIFLDTARGQWREKISSGSGNSLRIFDGKDLLRMEEGGEEYVKSKARGKDDDFAPSTYNFADPDLPKLAELRRQPCGFPGKDHECVVLQAPLKKSMRSAGPNTLIRVLDGAVRTTFDTETDLLVDSNTTQVIDNGRITYQLEIIRLLRRVRYGAPPDMALFKLPSSDIREVKELSRWNAAKIKKELTGKDAPDLEAMDLHGEPLTLSALKGRTVLLDFWTTWCPPCRADAPALEKLHQKYGTKDLTIIGISVSEEREVVEKFLKDHPHSYPILLTTENEMPRPYQIGVSPTYIVIDKDGTITAAVEGDKGFADLRKLLKKAGLEAE